MAARSRGRAEAEDIAAAPHDLSSRSETARAGRAGCGAKPRQTGIGSAGLERTKVARRNSLRRSLNPGSCLFGLAHCRPTVAGRAHPFPASPALPFA